ncbi:MAG: hypothetical protein ACYTGB_18635, partial [Planctomycetota bacterium]
RLVNDLKSIGRADALWGMAVYAAASPERLSQAERIAARLEQRRLEGADSPADWAYLAMAFKVLGRPTKASWCLDKGIFAAGLDRRAGAARQTVHDAAALLLAGARLDLQAAPMGEVYAAFLKAVAADPRVQPWPAAVAVHALTEWNETVARRTAPLSVSVGAHSVKLGQGRRIVRTPASGRLEVTLAEPPSGAVAVQIVCSYRVAHTDVRAAKDMQLERHFARVTPDGHAELLREGGALRLGDALLMVVQSRAPERHSVCVPLAGPWAAISPEGKTPLTRRIKRRFVLDRTRRARVLAAVDAERMPDVRAELVDAVDSGDFVVETVPVEDNLQGSGDLRFSGATDPAMLVPCRAAAALFRPDRTGSFLAPAAWIVSAKGEHPLAAAQPFAFSVLPADADLPSNKAEMLLAASLRRSVREALTEVSDQFLAARLKKNGASIDAREVALEGILCSDSRKAPAAYARLAWGSGTRTLSEIKAAAEWRLKAFGRMAFQRSGARSPNARVLATALGDPSHLQRIAAAPDFRVDPLRAYNTAVYTAFIESRLRAELYSRASVSPAADGIESHRLEVGQLVAQLPPQTVETLLDRWDKQPEPQYWHQRGRSLRSALADWAGRYGMQIRFGPKVTDLQAGEYLISLPSKGSTVQLDRSLRRLSLRARRSGLTVRVWLDLNLPETASCRVMRSAGRTPADRLLAFMRAPDWADKGLQDLVAAPPETSPKILTRYTPRLERPATLADSTLQELNLSTDRALADQQHLLAARGYRLEAKEGLLRIVPVR